MYQGIQRVCIVLCCTLLLGQMSACSGFLKPHKLTIQQGNIVTQDMLDKLETGMKPGQVKYVLGTPLLVDTMDPDTWYYLYSLRLGNGQTLSQQLVVNFENGVLKKFDSNYKFDDAQNRNKDSKKDEGESKPSVDGNQPVGPGA